MIKVIKNKKKRKEKHEKIKIYLGNIPACQTFQDTKKQFYKLPTCANTPIQI